MEEKLQVPENIALRRELWRGVGKFEICAILATTLANTLAAFLVCSFFAQENTAPVTVFVAILGFAVGNGFFAKMEANQSLFDYLLRSTRYRKEQQTFYYVRTQKEVYRIEPQEKAS